MIFVWGKKAVYRRLGYVADFCPICIGVKPFILERVGMAGHVYYITAGEGDLVGYQINCLECNILLNSQAERYAAFAEKQDALPALIKQTFPKLVEFHKVRLLLENQVRTALPTLPEDTRRSLILEPFLLLGPSVVKYFEKTQFQRGKTFIKQEIIPVLADTLARLRPAEQELKAALTRLVQQGQQIGKRIKLDDLVAALEERNANAPPAGGTTFGTSEFASPQPTIVKMPRKGLRAAGSRLGYEKAALLIKVEAWIMTAGLVIILLGSMSKDKAITSADITVFALCCAIGAGLHLLSWGIGRHLKWARVTGMLYGVLSLLAFPIGTLLGGFIVWHLAKGWGDDADASAYA